MLDFLVISDGRLQDLEKTLCSIVRCSLPDSHFKVYVKSLPAAPDIENEVRDKFPKVIFEFSSDAGIYDAMNRLLATSNSDYFIFINAGDCILPGILEPSNIERLRPNEVLYSDVYLGNRIIVSRYWPMLMKMPNHQSMIVPNCVARFYRFPEDLSISGDLHLKLTLWKQNYQYVKHCEAYIQIAPPGVSAVVNRRNFVNRVSQMAKLSFEFFSLPWAMSVSIFYLAWYSFKMLRERP